MNKKGLITVATLLFLSLASPFAGTAIIRLQTADQIYNTVDQIPQKEIALVLGAAVHGDKLSDILRDRVETAIELYKAEKISALIMSGGPHEAIAMKKYAVNEGIPEDSVIEDSTGLNTLASIKSASELERSMIIVTQEYHLPRALFIANTLGLDATGIIADKIPYLRINDFKQREIWATSKAVLDLFILK